MALRSGFILAVLPLFLFAGAINAAPYLPKSDDQVLERLPFKPNDPLGREMAQLRAQLQRDPRNVDVAIKLAQRYYGLVAEEGDPRYLGYAQAALAPWWSLPEPPVEVQVLRAALGQFRHDFDGAIADLTKVIERDPKHPQARSLRATIHIVQARYAQARLDCTALSGIASKLIATGCVAMVDGLSGKAESAYQTLNAEFKAHPEASPADQLWVLTRLAELAQRRGDDAVAESHFRQAVALGITDTFLLAAYADFLLDKNRPAEVVAMLKDKTPSDTLLLRLVFAERMLNLPSAKAREATLASRFQAAQLRGDTVHQQEEARFALIVQNDPRKALSLAGENWKVQREPRDARIFLEAALAAREPAAAQPVIRWLDESRIEDRQLSSLAQQVKGGPK
ncbi:MAG: hypothetical protein JWQ23_3343 [Herminiimonas sp.]|nr:hypothetical protein [Herminiimonas sp.]